MNALQYAARPSAVFKYFGQLCIVFGGLSTVPLAVAIVCTDHSSGVRYAVIAVGSLLLGLLLTRLPAPRRLQTNEAMAVSAMIFLYSALAASWPAMAAGLSFPDALFETISAVTTTGLTVTATVADKPAAFLFARAWMQWIGGLGIVVLSLTALIQPGLTAKRLADFEERDGDLVGGTRAFARRILVVYAALTAFGIILLGLLQVGWFNAVLYTFAAVSTGGFAPHDASLSGLGGTGGPAAVILLSIAGALPLALYYQMSLGDRRALVADRQLWGLLVLGLTTAAVLACFLCLRSGFSWTQAVYHGWLTAFSAQSTAGFSSTGIAGLDPGAKLTLIFSMMAGGSAGSTAGGIKVIRLLIVMQVIYLIVRRTGMPREAVDHARLEGRRLESEEIQNALCLVMAFLSVTGFSWLLFVVMGYRPLDALFEVVSAMGTVGLSAGLSGPELHPLLKGVLCADMLMGRLEILAWLVLVSPGTWLGNRLED
jgi:trk system potassium uptake protein TrkH